MVPDPFYTLHYLWLQLDANLFAPGSDAATTATTSNITRLSYNRLKTLLVRETFDGGVKDHRACMTAADKPLKHTIVKTMMRIDLNKPLASGESMLFSIDWNYRINDCKVLTGRTGYEFFKEDGNYLYEMAQWFPRMVAYTDATGWQHKQFIGRGEFTLEFGDYLGPADRARTTTSSARRVSCKIPKRFSAKSNVNG